MRMHDMQGRVGCRVSENQTAVLGVLTIRK